MGLGKAKNRLPPVFRNSMFNHLNTETVITIAPAELNASLPDKIKSFIGSRKNSTVTISLKEFDPDYVNTLDQSILQAENGDVISVTMEEFVAYTPN